MTVNVRPVGKLRQLGVRTQVLGNGAHKCWWVPEVPTVAQAPQWVLSPGDVGASKEGRERAVLATACVFPLSQAGACVSPSSCPHSFCLNFSLWRPALNLFQLSGSSEGNPGVVGKSCSIQAAFLLGEFVSQQLSSSLIHPWDIQQAPVQTQCSKEKAWSRSRLLLRQAP